MYGVIYDYASVTSVYIVHVQNTTVVGLHGSASGVGHDWPRVVGQPGRGDEKSEREKREQNCPVGLHGGQWTNLRLALVYYIKTRSAPRLSASVSNDASQYNINVYHKLWYYYYYYYSNGLTVKNSITPILMSRVDDGQRGRYFIRDRSLH